MSSLFEISSSNLFQKSSSSLMFASFISLTTSCKRATFLPAPQPVAVAAPTALAMVNV
ncbi:hypothetical protein HanPSC8_Chr10g0408731 [Helianthus annuus]|nr:hypothetical protein HanPSC8_Chr10g0408731 [Helianthus annuus]